MPVPLKEQKKLTVMHYLLEMNPSDSATLQTLPLTHFGLNLLWGQWLKCLHYYLFNPFQGFIEIQTFSKVKRNDSIEINLISEWRRLFFRVFVMFCRPRNTQRRVFPALSRLKITLNQQCLRFLFPFLVLLLFCNTQKIIITLLH